MKVTPESAILTSDYTDPPSTITFNTGDFNTTKYILLPITNDSIFEVAERLLVLLDDDVDPKVDIKAPDVATVTITDDDSK